MSAHTPGPWHLADEPVKYHWQIYSEKYKRVGTTPCGGAKNTLAQMNEYLANSRLIAAAPELLSWLKWSLKLLPDDAKQSGQYEMALAAIAKANGDQT